MNNKILLALVVVAALVIVGAVSLSVTGLAVSQCRDGIDNDKDTKIDYPADTGCSSRYDTSERGTIKCDNGLDDDGDTKIDYPNDPGCSSPSDTNERGTIKCDNGINDDNDGLVDYPADPGCTSPSDTSELGTVQCDDNIDNDKDTKIDYPADTLCASAKDNDEADSSCADTDGGYVPFVQGTVSGSFNGQPFSNTDSCITPTLLKELYCSGPLATNMTYNCVGNSTTQCLDGACA